MQWVTHVMLNSSCNWLYINLNKVKQMTAYCQFYVYNTNL